MPKIVFIASLAAFGLAVGAAGLTTPQVAAEPTYDQANKKKSKKKSGPKGSHGSYSGE